MVLLRGEVECRVTEVEPPTARPTDLSPLVSAAQSGDEEAFRSLYRMVQPGLLRYLRALVGDDAEDVASETWLQIARDLRSFRGREGFRAWAATIGRNRALDHLRHRRRRPAVSTPIEQLVELPGGGDTAESASESISTDAALAMIRSLPRDQAEAVLLRVVVGLDAETAGRVLGKRAGAVRTASYRGLRRLAERLDQLLTAARDQPPDEGVTDTSATTPTGTT
jgi:RNA polymerase sigma-70 factor (ECF subfamily)